MQGESYWRLAELPVETASVFIVNAVPDLTRSKRRVSMLVIGIEQLLDVLERVGADAVLSVYLVYMEDDGSHDNIKVNRVTAIGTGDSEELGWKKVFILETVAGSYVINANECSVADRLVNKCSVIQFPVRNTAVT